VVSLLLSALPLRFPGNRPKPALADAEPLLDPSPNSPLENSPPYHRLLALLLVILETWIKALGGDDGSKFEEYNHWIRGSRP